MAIEIKTKTIPIEPASEPTQPEAVSEPEETYESLWRKSILHGAAAGFRRFVEEHPEEGRLCAIARLRASLADGRAREEMVLQALDMARAAAAYARGQHG